jgi:hypothetical protein
MKFSFDLFLSNYMIDPSIRMSVLHYSFNCLQTIPGTHVAILGAFICAYKGNCLCKRDCLGAASSGPFSSAKRRTKIK